MTSPGGSKSFTSAATRTGNSLASNARIQSIPLRPATADSQVEGASLPSGVTAPRPVTATRLMRRGYGPRLTLSETFAPRNLREPATGRCRSTTPRFARERTRVTFPTEQ